MSVPYLRSPVGLSYAVVTLLGLCALTDVFGILLSFSAMAQSGLVANPGRFDGLYDGLVGTQGVVFLACAIVFCAWLWRVRVNAETFRPDGHKHSRAWVWWGWGVPFVSFWYPRRIVLDVWRASAPQRSSTPGTGLVNLWWGFWLICQIEGATPEMAEKDMGTSTFDTAAAYSVGFALLDLVAACLAVAIVRGITSAQCEKAMAGPALSTEPA